MNTLYKSVLLLCAIPLLSFTVLKKWKHEKSRTIKKEYAISADGKVDIDNRYGNVNITTWDKNKVEIEVTITVKGNNLEAVENRLSDIDVDFYNTSNLVEAKTRIAKNNNSWSWWGKNRNINYKINYKVKMPISNEVAVDNDYGNIYLDDINGKASINCDYGKVALGNLNNSLNEINLDYCSGSSADYIKNGTINVDYSGLDVEKAGTIKLNTDYSNLDFGKVDELSFNADYGSITVEDGTNINGTSDYASMRFGTVRKNLTVETDYGSLRIKNLAKGFENVSITGQYAGIRLGVEEGASFNFEVSLQYASFRKNEDKMEIFKSIEKSTKKYYEGVYGKNPTGKVKIRSQYGGVTIKENY